MKTPALMISALLGFSAAHAAPACQDMADTAAKVLAAEKRSDLDKPTKCKAVYKVISDLTDIAHACGVDEKFIDGTYKPLAKSAAAEAENVCRG
jgi:hypothetical protein